MDGAESKLNRVLLADGMTAGLAGIGLVALPGGVARLAGVASTLPIIIVGAGLIVFGVALLRLSRQPSRKGTQITAALNLAWVAGTIVLVLDGGLSGAANWVLSLAGINVLGFALLELKLLPARAGSGTSSPIATRAIGLVLLLALPAIGLAQGASARDAAAVRAVASGITEAWNAGDSRALAAAFTTDGTLIAGDGTMHTGRADIERYFDELRIRLPDLTRFASTETSIRFLTTNMALLVSHGGFLRAEETVVAPERRGLQSYLVVRQHGSWRVALLQRTRIPPPPAGK